VHTIAPQAFEFLADSDEENVKTVTSNLNLVTNKICSAFIALMRENPPGTGDCDSDLEMVPLAPPLPPLSRQPWHFSMPPPSAPPSQTLITDSVIRTYTQHTLPRTRTSPIGREQV
jgi:hypothetical protein